MLLFEIIYYYIIYIQILSTNLYHSDYEINGHMKSNCFNN